MSRPSGSCLLRSGLPSKGLRCRSRLRNAFFAAGLLAFGGTVPAAAQILDILTAPKTLVDRAIEARSAEDIAKDNEIVLKVNGIMAKLGTIKASTEIYEQRLLVTGLFDDKATYDNFERSVRNVRGVKQLYWHVIYIPKAEQERSQLMDWPDVVALEAKAQGRLIGTAGVADVNYRLTGDALGTIYLLGRARSDSEMDKAVARAWDGEGVTKVVNYVQVRP